ncbi:hypothetical protein [Gordonia westfalica]|uniref:hypothetical protein n=1 Tax=Gordonia westfalica TaxID=158898 RepID=UPI0011144238|nr:hypothetical protein [Gordonia westfalica]
MANTPREKMQEHVDAETCEVTSGTYVRGSGCEDRRHGRTSARDTRRGDFLLLETLQGFLCVDRARQRLLRAVEAVRPFGDLHIRFPERGDPVLVLLDLAGSIHLRGGIDTSTGSRPGMGTANFNR